MEGEAEGMPPLTVELMALMSHWSLAHKDVRYLYAKFRQLDADGSGSIDTDEFFHFLRERRTVFLETMFRMMVPAGTEELDFVTWAHVVFSFCLATRDEMVERVFLMFDKDRDGFIGLSELHAFLVGLHSENPIFPQEIVTSMTETVLRQDGKMDFDDLLKADSEHPMLLWPVFRINNRMRKQTLGTKFFRLIDDRLANTGYAGDAKRHSKWRQRYEILALYCCGWGPCARRRARRLRRRRRRERRRKAGREDDGSSSGSSDAADAEGSSDLSDDGAPTPLLEVAARKRAVRRLRQEQVRREVRPRNSVRRFKPLPDGPHHNRSDAQIERDVYQAHLKPIRDNELRQRPPTIRAINDSGHAYELETSGSETDELVDYGRDDEYPDLIARRHGAAR